MSTTASGLWGPAPAGVDLSENQNAHIIAAVSVVTVIALVAVILRLWARISRSGPGIGVDDYVIVTAFILSLGNAVTSLISIQWGGGKHLWVVTLDQYAKLSQTSLAGIIVYIASVTFTKASILLFYRRVFGSSWVLWTVAGLTCAHGLEVIIIALAGCHPLQYRWEQFTNHTVVGSCINLNLFYLVNGIVGLLIDIAVLAVPIPTSKNMQAGSLLNVGADYLIVYKLQMRTAQKLVVYSILLLGSFVCVASAVRIVVINKSTMSRDFTWATCQVFIWSSVEPSIGILCACLPTYAHLVRRWYSTAVTITSRRKSKKNVTPQGRSESSFPTKRGSDSLTESSVGV